MTDGPAAAPATVLQGGRAKAYRPLPAPDRAAAFEAGLAAYDRGDFFLAHELLEPAWMGTADLGERELYQGLIKVAAAYVHDVRGNPLGTAKNLQGARAHLAEARARGWKAKSSWEPRAPRSFDKWGRSRAAGPFRVPAAIPRRTSPR